jgi:hypothetical protein
MEFEFEGSLTVPLDVDPSEYEGLEIPEVTEELLNLLAAMAPGADFFEDDVANAAAAIYENCNEP